LLILPELGLIDLANLPSTEIVFVDPSEKLERIKTKILRYINMKRE